MMLKIENILNSVSEEYIKFQINSSIILKAYQF